MGQIQQLTQHKKIGLPHFGGIEELSDNNLEGKRWDNEVFLRRTFEEDVNAGISLLFQQYYPMLCSHAVRYVSSKTIAEDIVSDIFYEFQVDLRYKTITASYKAYLFTAVRNRAFDHVRAEMKRTTSLDKAELVPAHQTHNPDSITQYEELYHDVENAINSMPLKRRQIYVMHCGVNMMSIKGMRFKPQLPAFLNELATGSDNASLRLNWITETTLNYNKSFGKHNLTGLVGYTTQKETFELNTMTNNKYPE